MRFTTMLSVALKTAAAAALGLAVLGAPVAAGAATGTSGGTWVAAQPFPGFSASNATVQAITCPSLGNCVAVGYTSAASTNMPIVSAETNGVWGSAQVINGTGSLGNGSGGMLTNVSCGGPGDCAATGTYHGTNGVATAFYVSETAGKWGTPAAVTSSSQPAGTDSEVNGLSCGDVGYCTIVGRYTDQGVHTAGLTVSTPFTLDEANGAWGTPQPVPGLAGLPSPGNLNTLDSVSCTGDSDCTASGEYGGSGVAGLPFVVSETGGTWGNAEQLTGTLTAEDTTISCPDPADCTVAATYLAGTGTRAIFTSDESNGAWGQLQLLAMPSSTTDIATDPLLGCRAAGNCVIFGNMDLQVGTKGSTGPFAATEITSGGWGAAATLPGIPPATEIGMVQGLSCVPEGDCTFSGSAQADTGTPAYIWAGVSGADGSIGTVQQVYEQASGDTVVGLSCPQNGHCTLAAELDYKYMLGTETTASTVTLAASAPKVTYGAEQSETLTATASSAAVSTPTGTVTVTDGTLAACTITLTGGTGGCTLTATALPVGTDQLTADYNGDANYAPASSTATITVGPAASAVTYSGTIRLSKMGYCLDDRNNSGGNGAVVQVWRCNGLASQRWQVMSDGTIRHNGLCLDAVGSGTANGTKVQLWACTGHGNQKWDTKGFRIHYDNPAATGKVLDDTGYGGDGTRQQIWANTGSINQIWATS
jgi:Ricin-type beta-trefoil lectin domain/Bacterial Ig-like domain (group 3)